MKTFLLGFALLASLTVSATTYYVAPEGAEGAADADGYGTSIDKPFATIAHAYSKLKGGADINTHNEMILLRGTHKVTARIANGMLNYSVIRGETGDPADVTIDFGELSDACLLVADIQLRDVTVSRSNATIDSRGGALRVQSTESTYAAYPAMVSNCVFTAAKACAVAVTGPAQILDCRFESNELEGTSGKYNSLVYVTSDGSSKGVRLIKGCSFANNKSPANGTCINAGCVHDWVEIEDCTFEDNTTDANAADVFVNNKARLIGSTFLRSSAANNGGAVYLNTRAELEASDCRFESCRATLSGAAVSTAAPSSSLFAFTDTAFISNTAEKTGGALYLHSATGALTRCTARGNVSATQAAGFARVASSARLTVADSTIDASSAQTQGGAFFVDIAESADATTYGALTLLRSSFSGNVAWCEGSSGNLGIHGGGVVALGNATTGQTAFAPLFVDRCVFTTNSTPGSGGAIYMRNASNVADSCRTDIRNSLFVGNAAGSNGGAINLVAYKAWVDNCTFVTNTANGSGPNFYHRWTSYFRNCLLVSDMADKSGTFCGQAASPNLYLNSIQVGRTDSNMKACFTEGNGCANLTMDELAKIGFVDADNDNYAITASSLARNKGENLDWMSDDASCRDLAGKARVFKTIAEGGVVDIGCYEYWCPPGMMFLIR